MLFMWGDGARCDDDIGDHDNGYGDDHRENYVDDGGWPDCGVVNAEIAVSSPGMPEAYPKKWLTFCVEGSIEDIEAFLGGTGKPLVALLSLREALQVGYPHFVHAVSAG